MLIRGAPSDFPRNVLAGVSSLSSTIEWENKDVGEDKDKDGWMREKSVILKDEKFRKEEAQEKEN
ncbi:hypothetical protein E2C01_066240 [Portunus trituberculatus]|uniref:Uncharacterized protein n=1 Tax=Portunus trituberculatus TaxID=210409 RepID=A0A5B7HTB6_PORTR|nr:hypothetical protein [Portunus trituberculatus]